MLRKVFVIRHGTYDDDTEHLDKKGIEQISKLVPVIKQYISGEQSVFIVSSPALRAEDSAQIIGTALNLPYTLHESFFEDHNLTPNSIAALEALEEIAIERSTEVAIVVTHMEYGELLPEAIRVAYGKNFFTLLPLDKGRMVYIDIENNTSKYF